jgi:hypothetical protein
MYGHDGAPSIGVAKEVMASLDPDDFKPKTPRHSDELDAREGRKPAHDLTATR